MFLFILLIEITDFDGSDGLFDEAVGSPNALKLLIIPPPVEDGCPAELDTVS